jgi:hypothetical protein
MNSGRITGVFFPKAAQVTPDTAFNEYDSEILED